MAFTPKLYLLTIFFLLLLTLSSTSFDETSYTAPRPVSYLRLAAATEDTCHGAYGFMPCSTSWIGNLFLILVYGYMMYRGAVLSSSGSDLLLEIVGSENTKSKNICRWFLSVGGELPGPILVLASGLSKSVEAAQAQVSIGAGELVGSTILLLTVVWGSCVVVGKCVLQDSTASDKADTKGYSLTGSGISTYIWTCYAARIMGISAIPFIIVQVPQILSSTSGRHLAVLIALVVSIALLISYCLYQFFRPWIQRRMLAYVEHKRVIFEFLRHLKRRALGRLTTDDGEVNEEVVKKIFKTIDKNDDGYLSAGELKALIVGIRFAEIDLDENEAVNKIMRDFDTSRDSQLDESEFVNAIRRWLNRAVGAAARAGRRNFGNTMKVLDDFHHETSEKHAQLLVGDQSEEEGEVIDNPKQASLKAMLLLVLGTIIAAAFATPLKNAVVNFSDTASIPSFFTSFVALPLATHFDDAIDAIDAIRFASHKKLGNASLTFSELYATVTMNNVLCLSVFLALVYIRGLTWDFSAEVLVILVVCILMSALASFRTTYPLWTCLVAFLLYPSSLALVYVLDYVLGWS